MWFINRNEQSKVTVCESVDVTVSMLIYSQGHHLHQAD